MKPGRWYICGFVVTFVYFYVYAVNYVRGVRGEINHGRQHGRVQPPFRGSK